MRLRSTHTPGAPGGGVGVGFSQRHQAELGKRPISRGLAPVGGRPNAAAFAGVSAMSHAVPSRLRSRRPQYPSCTRPDSTQWSALAPRSCPGLPDPPSGVRLTRRAAPSRAVGPAPRPPSPASSRTVLGRPTRPTDRIKTNQTTPGSQRGSRSFCTTFAAPTRPRMHPASPSRSPSNPAKWVDIYRTPTSRNFELGGPLTGGDRWAL